jgi:hypothetical protein
VIALKLTKGQHKALVILASMPAHLEWHLHSYAKSGVAEGTLSALRDRGLVVFERYKQEIRNVRNGGTPRETREVRWVPQWRARITDAGRALVASEVPS